MGNNSSCDSNCKYPSKYEQIICKKYCNKCIEHYDSGYCKECHKIHSFITNSKICKLCKKCHSIKNIFYCDLCKLCNTDDYRHCNVCNKCININSNHRICNNCNKCIIITIDINEKCNECYNEYYDELDNLLFNNCKECHKCNTIDLNNITL